MNLPLTPELENMIAAKVSSGHYNSSYEVVYEALRLLTARDEIKQKKIEALNHDIQLGIDQINLGLGIPGENVYQELINKCDQDIKNATK